MSADPRIDLAEQLRAALVALDAVIADRSLLEVLPLEERTRLLNAAGDVYEPDVQVRRASLKDVIKFDSRSTRIGRAFSGEPVGVRPTPTAGLYEVFYAHQTLGRFDVSQTPRGSPEVLNIHRVLRE